MRATDFSSVDIFHANFPAAILKNICSVSAVHCLGFLALFKDCSNLFGSLGNSNLSDQTRQEKC